jgi:hypothetical protein
MPYSERLMPRLAMIVMMSLFLTTAAASGEPAPAEDYGPAAVALAFYAWYLSAAQTSAPLVDGSLDGRAELRDDFRLLLRLVVAGFRQGGYDPLLCAQDVPLWVDIVEVRELGVRAIVRVRTSFVSHGFDVVLDRHDERWRIDEVRCAPPRRPRLPPIRST